MKKEARSPSAQQSASSPADVLKTLQTKSKEELIALLVAHLKTEHQIPDNEIRSALSQSDSMLPSAIFANDALSALETIVKYLKENKHFTLHRIATLLNRDDRSIWTTYNNAKKKMQASLAAEPSSFYVPATIFAERKLSVLETLTTYLKDVAGMSYHDIAVALRRDDRTIWTVCNRAQKKRGAA